MRIAAVATAALLMLGAGSAAAEESARPAKPQVVICERDGMAERALKREHGAAAWTNAAEVLAAVRAGDGWAAPRCISKLEYARMDDGIRQSQRTAKARNQAQRLLASR